MDIAERFLDEIWQKIYTKTHDGVLITDKDGTIIKCNPALSQITGYSEKELIGQNPKMLQSGQHHKKFYQKMFSTVYSRGRWEGQIINKHKNGSEIVEWLSLYAIKDDNGNIFYYVGLVSDITQLTLVSKSLENVEQIDSLTLLPNREGLKKHVEILMALPHTNDFTMMLLDLDNFKLINDAFGHHIGDETLNIIAKRLQALIRDTDYLCRFSGDKFVIIVRAIELGRLTAVIDRIVEQIAKPFTVDKHRLSMTVSIGISEYPRDGNNLDELLSNVDIAMYRAKEAGRNTHRFYNESQKELVINETMTFHKIKQGLSKDEFLVKYQPQVNLQTGEIIGVEALVRWASDTGIYYPPAHFLSVSEKYNLIHEIDRLVMEKSFRDFGQHKNQLHEKNLSLNVNAQHFLLDDYQRILNNLAEKYAVEPNFVTIELTESIFLDNFKLAIEKINELKRTGFRLSIDDFGTGYSSLQYLNEINFDELKIDKYFIRDIKKSRYKKILVSGIIMIAKKMKKQVVVEGIETSDELDRTKKYGAKIGQGFYLYKPMFLADLIKLLASLKR